MCESEINRLILCVCVCAEERERGERVREILYALLTAWVKECAPVRERRSEFEKVCVRERERMRGKGSEAIKNERVRSRERQSNNGEER